MPQDKPFRRLPLRALLTDAGKKSRGLGDHLNNTWLPRVHDLLDLSRPVRRKSQFPTPLALQNALRKVVATTGETDQMLETLLQQLDEIREYARRERLNRS